MSLNSLAPQPPRQPFTTLKGGQTAQLSRPPEYRVSPAFQVPQRGASRVHPRRRAPPETCKWHGSLCAPRSPQPLATSRAPHRARPATTLQTRRLTRNGIDRCPTRHQTATVRELEAELELEASTGDTGLVPPERPPPPPPAPVMPALPPVMLAPLPQWLVGAKNSATHTSVVKARRCRMCLHSPPPPAFPRPTASQSTEDDASGDPANAPRTCSLFLSSAGVLRRRFAPDDVRPLLRGADPSGSVGPRPRPGLWVTVRDNTLRMRALRNLSQRHWALQRGPLGVLSPLVVTRTQHLPPATRAAKCKCSRPCPRTACRPRRSRRPGGCSRRFCSPAASP